MNKKYTLILIYSSSIFAMGLSFLGSILNTHMLTKEAFGDWKFIQGFLVFLNTIINFGIFQAGGRLIAASNDKEKINAIKGYLIYGCIAGLFVMLLVIISSKLFGTRILSEHIFKLLIVYLPFFVAHPLMSYFDSVLPAQKKLIAYSLYKFMPPVFYVASLYLFRTRADSPDVSLQIILYYSSFLLVYVGILFYDKLSFKKRGVILSELLIENRAFGVHIYYGSLWGVGTGYLIVLLIGFFNVNNVDLGMYSLALSVITIMNFLPGIFGTAYFKDFIYSPAIPKKVMKMAIVSSAFLLLFVVITINIWIKLLLKPSYLPVGELVRIGAISAILHGFGDFINKFLSAKGMGKLIKNGAITVGVTQLAFSLILIPFFSAKGAMISRSIGSLVYFMFLFYHYYKGYIKKAGVLSEVIT